MGNHDAVVCGKLDVRLFNDDDSKIIPSARFVRLVIEGEHSGTVTIGAPHLTPADPGRDGLPDRPARRER